MRILIADDEPINLRVLEAFLVKWGYEIVIAHDGAEVLAHVVVARFVRLHAADLVGGP